jgi:hypothetical protein
MELRQLSLSTVRQREVGWSASSCRPRMGAAMIHMSSTEAVVVMIKADWSASSCRPRMGAAMIHMSSLEAVVVMIKRLGKSIVRFSIASLVSALL